MLWLELILDPGAGSDGDSAYVEVVDALELPTAMLPARLLPAQAVDSPPSHTADPSVSEVVALVSGESVSKVFPQIRAAWRADLEEWRLRPVPVEQVRVPDPRGCPEFRRTSVAAPY